MNMDMFDKWSELANMDLSAAETLVYKGKDKDYISAMYHCQQAVEKILKAYIFSALEKSEREYRIHDLVDLAECTELEMSENMLMLIDGLNPMTREARYEIRISKILVQIDFEIAKTYFLRTKEFLEWIGKKLYERQSGSQNG